MRKLQQHGFSLFIVLIVMLVIAFMVIAGVQSIGTENRISTNDADRKFALAEAEAELFAAEQSLVKLPKTRPTFSWNCENGHCLPAGGAGVKPNLAGVTEPVTIPENGRMGGTTCQVRGCQNNAWERENVFTCRGQASRACHIIEYLYTDNEGRSFFRITARAYGENSNTVVTLQSYVQAELQSDS